MREVFLKRPRFLHENLIGPGHQVSRGTKTGLLFRNLNEVDGNIDTAGNTASLHELKLNSLTWGRFGGPIAITFMCFIGAI